MPARPISINLPPPSRPHFTTATLHIQPSRNQPAIHLYDFDADPLHQRRQRLSDLALIEHHRIGGRPPPTITAQHIRQRTFSKTPALTAAGEPTGGTFQGRIEGALDLRLPNGLSLRATGAYDGIGSNGYRAVQGGARLTVPLQ